MKIIQVYIVQAIVPMENWEEFNKALEKYSKAHQAMADEVTE